ncbi:hypothetical protein P8452_53142 [Trifolium repens]|nr:hypothetical protein P8452_53142 [Trifolium repens]
MFMRRNQLYCGVHRVFAVFVSVGRRIEFVVVPLELMQQLKASDFTDQQEYDEWQKRTLKVLETWVLSDPNPPSKKNPSAVEEEQPRRQP